MWCIKNHIKCLLLNLPIGDVADSKHRQQLNGNALGITAHARFIQDTPDKSFLVNYFADFQDVPVKKSKFHPVDGGVWN